MGTFIRAGGSIVLIPKYDAQALIQTIQDEKATYLIAVPTIIREMMEVESVTDTKLESLKYVLCSGDALKPDTLRAFEDQFHVPVLEGYGLTEASPMVSFNNPRQVRKAGSIGHPLPGVDMKIIDEHHSEIRPGQVGEIIVQGPNVMKGYLKMDEATNEVIKDGWLYTGDLARLDEDGYASIVVRKKNVILKSGFSVYPREVENILKAHPKVEEAVVVGIPDPLLGEEIYSAIQLKGNETGSSDDMITYSKDNLATYKCPKAIYFMDTIPKGPTGRILRDEVRTFISNKLES
jgi:long-chain acyl-CoA synthetase